MLISKASTLWKKLSQIDLNDVQTAISNAEKLKNAKLDSDRMFYLVKMYGILINQTFLYMFF